MIPFIICSGVFLLIYYALLVKEKMFVFNRMYLLLALGLSLVIPYISFDFTERREYQHIPNATQWIEQATYPLSMPNAVYVEPIQQVNYWVVLYWAVTAVLLVRFSLNLKSILLLIYKNEKITSGKTTFVLLKSYTSSSSFLHYVFVNKTDYLENKIPEEVLFHEKRHGLLKHTIDTLILEIAQVFAWFNPFVYLYKRAGQLNHEFEVDEKVVRHFGSASRYQYLLINQAANSSKLIHSFNFVHIKKRILMITRNSHPLIVFVKALLSTTFVLVVSFLFTEKSFAQNIAQQTQKAVPVQMKTLELTNEDLAEFKALEAKALTHSTKGKEYKFTSDETNRMGDIYIKMSKEEQEAQKITLMPNKRGYAKPQLPTKEQFEAFKDPKMYGVWLDGKRIKNDDLNKYKNTDFSGVFESILLKNAAHYGQYKYHLALTTHETFKREQAEARKDPSHYIIWYKEEYFKQIRKKTK